MRRRPGRILRTTALLVCLHLHLSAHLRPQEVPRFELRLSGPCGETVLAGPGSHYDDGTGGVDFFFDLNQFFRNSEEVSNDRPGHTWDVILQTTDNPTIGTVRTIDCREPRAMCDPADCADPAVECVFGPQGDPIRMTVPGDRGAQGWTFTLATEGALAITDITSSGTRSCDVNRGPTCLSRDGFSVVELVGPPLVLPDGRTIPRLERSEGSGVVSAVILGLSGSVTLPPDEEESVIAKIRVFGTFPTRVADTASGRLIWDGLSVFAPDRVRTAVGFDGSTIDRESDPPLVLTDCEVTLRSAVEDPIFTRGDADGDGSITVSDVVVHIRIVLGRLPARFACDDALDVNDDGRADLSDAVRLLLYFFGNGEPPAAPFPGCGEDRNPDDALQCIQHSPFCRDAG